MKGIVAPGTLFEELGWHYIGHSMVMTYRDLLMFWDACPNSAGRKFCIFEP